MSTHTQHPLAADYLDRLRRAGRGLPSGRLRELVADVEAHLAEAIDPQASDSEALTVLDRLGEPEEIVAAERPEQTVVQDGGGTREWAAIILLLFGGFLAGIGWVVGLIFLWSSRAWTTRDKLIGTLVVPGGLATIAILGSVFIGGTSTCVSVPGSRNAHCIGGGTGPGEQVLAIVLLVLCVVGPIVTAVYLARRARRPGM